MWYYLKRLNPDMKEQVTDIIYLCWCFVLSCRKQLLANETANLTFIGLDKKNEKKRRKVRKKIWGKIKKNLKDLMSQS